MTDVTLPAPAWYDDPTVAGQQRWWDGTGWTEYVQQPPTPEPEVVAQPAWLTQDFGTPAASHSGAGSGFGSASYAPMSTFSSGPAVSYRDIPSRWGTVSVWLLALLPWPIVIPFLAIIFAYVQSGLSADESTTLIFLVVISAAIYGIPIFWAMRDRDVLRQYGYERPPHFAWVFLAPLAYLIVRFVRTRAEAGVGGAPLWTHIVSLLSYPVIVGIFSAVLTLATGQGLAEEMEAGIEQGFAEAGLPVEAVCPEEMVFEANTKFSCVLTQDNGSTAVLTGTWGATQFADPKFDVPQFSPAP